MANFLFLLSFLSGYVLLGMLFRPCAAVDDREVERVEGLLGELVENERARYCNLCTYICPRLFDRIQKKGILSIYENREADVRAAIEPFITPLLKPLKSHPDDSITPEDCQDYCSPSAKASLKETMEELAPEYGEAVRDREAPFKQTAINLASQRILEKIETDANMIFGCRDDIEGRSKATIPRAPGDNYYENVLDLFQKEFLWE